VRDADATPRARLNISINWTNFKCASSTTAGASEGWLRPYVWNGGYACLPAGRMPPDNCG